MQRRIEKHLSNENHAGTEETEHEARLEDEPAGAAGGDGSRPRLGGGTGTRTSTTSGQDDAGLAAGGNDDDGRRVGVVPAGDGGGLVLAGVGTGAVGDARGALGDGESHGHGGGLGGGGGQVDLLVIGLGGRDHGQAGGDDGEDSLELHFGGVVDGASGDGSGTRDFVVRVSEAENQQRDRRLSGRRATKRDFVLILDK